MPTCLICYNLIKTRYDPQHRPASCKCHYDVHRICYETWLEKTDSNYHCLICRHTIRRPDEFPMVLRGEIPMRPGYLIPVAYQRTVTILILLGLVIICRFFC